MLHPERILLRCTGGKCSTITSRFAVRAEVTPYRARSRNAEASQGLKSTSTKTRENTVEIPKLRNKAFLLPTALAIRHSKAQANKSAIANEI